jgi:hypothetical protein
VVELSWWVIIRVAHDPTTLEMEGPIPVTLGSQSNLFPEAREELTTRTGSTTLFQMHGILISSPLHRLVATYIIPLTDATFMTFSYTLQQWPTLVQVQPVQQLPKRPKERSLRARSISAKSFKQQSPALNQNKPETENKTRKLVSWLIYPLMLSNIDS